MALIARFYTLADRFPDLIQVGMTWDQIAGRIRNPNQGFAAQIFHT